VTSFERPAWYLPRGGWMPWNVGSTNWHSHDDQDEVFLLIEGSVTIQMRDRDVDLGPGDLFVVPRGTEHRPTAHEEARFLLVGPEVTSNAAGGKPDWSSTGARLSRLVKSARSRRPDAKERLGASGAAPPPGRTRRG
jgi:uncharacterized cupin superfamily protein